VFASLCAWRLRVADNARSKVSRALSGHKTAQAYRGYAKAKSKLTSRRSSLANWCEKGSCVARGVIDLTGALRD